MENVWTMSELKVLPPPGEIRKDGVTAVVDVVLDTQERPAGFITLRVKPDRRCVQIPIPADLDRRRPR
jgi:hypothetical protein